MYQGILKNYPNFINYFLNNMIYKNKVTIIGSLGKDPDIKKTQNDKEFAILSVATSEFFKDKEGNSEQKTEWHNITVFTPHFVNLIKEYPKKGDTVYVEGSLSTSKYQDSNGKDSYRTQILVKSFNDDFQFESHKVKIQDES